MHELDFRVLGPVQVVYLESEGAGPALQTDARDYGVGIYYENRQTQYTGWQKEEVFNNVRSRWVFGIPAKGTVRARAYLILGSYATIRGIVNELDIIEALNDLANSDKSQSGYLLGDINPDGAIDAKDLGELLNQTKNNRRAEWHVQQEGTSG